MNTRTRIAMQFYQTVAPMILSIIYIATIFGAEETTLPEVIEKIPENICRLIDKFRGKNNAFYEETTHLKRYSHLLDSVTNYSAPRKLLGINRPTITTLACSLLSLAGLKVFSRTPNKVVPPLSLAIGFTVDHIIANQLIASYLTIKFPAGITILDDQKRIVIRELVSGGTRRMEARSLSDMQPRNITEEERIEQTYLPLDHQGLVKKDELTYVLENGQVNIYLPDDDYVSENKLNSLPTSANITEFDVSKDESTIVTLDENGVRAWKLQSREPLDSITKSYRSSFLQEEE